MELGWLSCSGIYSGNMRAVAEREVYRSAEGALK
jgi:hypothetical protein